LKEFKFTDNFKEIDKERSALSETIWNIHKLFPKEYQKQYNIDIEAKDIIRKLIVFVQDGNKNKAQVSTMIATLKVLR